MEPSKSIAITSSKLSENYNGLDLMKFLCSFLICAIHIRLWPNNLFPYSGLISQLIKQCVARVAVPFYFTASGFLLFRKIDPSNPDCEPIKKFCFKLLRILGTWSILLFYGSTAHLWYLGASVIAVLILYFCYKIRLKLLHIAILAIVLYVLALTGSTYSSLLQPVTSLPIIGTIHKLYFHIFDTTRNGVFMGFPFVFLGAVFARTNFKMPMWLAVTGLFLSMMAMAIEMYIFYKLFSFNDFNMLLSLVPATFFLFYCSLSIKLKDSKVYPKLRTIGALVYYAHWMIASLIQFSLIILRKYTGLNITPFLFPLTIIVVYPLAAWIEHLSHKEKLKWVRFLYD